MRRNPLQSTGAVDGLAVKIEDAGIERATIRSLLTCAVRHWVCAMYYGPTYRLATANASLGISSFAGHLSTILFRTTEANDHFVKGF